jgi:AcrR family transcriptional regulator
VTAAKHKSRTVSKPQDPRARASRDKIRAAFAELLHRRQYANLRVSDICRKARVGRATFYAQFESKHELLRHEMRHVVVPMLKSSPRSACLFDGIALFEHIRHASLIYRSLTSGPSRLITEGIVRDCLEERIAADIRRAQAAAHGAGRGNRVVGEVAVRFVAASLLTLIAWWVENDAAASPQEIQAAFETLVIGGLRPMAV